MRREQHILATHFRRVVTYSHSQINKTYIYIASIKSYLRVGGKLCTLHKQQLYI